MKQSENTIEAQVKKYLGSLDSIWFFKVHGSGYQKKGVPDIVGCYKGRFFAIELKKEGKTPTLIQSLILKQLQNAGAVAFVASDVETVKQYIH